MLDSSSMAPLEAEEAYLHTVQRRRSELKPITQTIVGRGPKFGESYGNCLQAALASVLDLQLEDVPHFVWLTRDEPAATAAWHHAMNQWLAAHFGLNVVYFRAGDEPGAWKPTGYHLLSGTSPRGSMHETVGLDGELAHDPHPAGGGVSGEIWFGVFVTVDPARLSGAARLAA